MLKRIYILLCMCCAWGCVSAAVQYRTEVLDSNVRTLRVQYVEQSGVELICLAGYMRLLSEAFVNRYPERIINIHPSLLPAFKGAHAIEQAFEYGVKIYGVTIHYVDATMDGGKIISQQAVPYEGQDIAELEAMLHALEHELYINTINKLIAEQKI